VGKKKGRGERTRKQGSYCHDLVHRGDALKTGNKKKGETLCLEPKGEEKNKKGGSRKDVAPL